MTVAAPRPTAQRTADTLAMLATPAIDVWVATADAVEAGARAHLVPLSLAWIEGRVVLAVEATSRTARNLRAQGACRLALGPTRDVVMIDAVLDGVVAVDQAPPDLADGYAAQADWDPRGSAGYAYLVLRPERIQAWRESNEISGRTIMRDGNWLVRPGGTDQP